MRSPLSESPARISSRVPGQAGRRRLLLLAMASLLLLSGCMLSPLFQAPGLVLTAVSLLLGLAACSSGGGGGGGGSTETPPANTPAYVPPTVPGCASNLTTTGSQITSFPPVVNVAQVQSDLSLGLALFGGEGAAYSLLGPTLAAGCDLNGDQNVDLAIGTYHFTGSGGQGGRVYVVFGGPNFSTAFAPTGGSSTTGFEVSSLTGALGFSFTATGGSMLYTGKALAMGDVTGDGVADLIIGAPGSNYTGQENGQDGAAWVIFGGANISTVTTNTIGTNGIAADGSTGFLIKSTEAHGSAGAQTRAYNNLGASVAVTEVGGDGLADIVLGAPRAAYASSGLNYTAIFPRAAFVFGSNSAHTGGTYDVSGGVIVGEGYAVGSTGFEYHDTNLGDSVAVAGDLNGDGILDTVVGAPYAYSEIGGDQYGVGAAYVLFGKSGNPPSTSPAGLAGAGFALLGERQASVASSYMGYVVAPAGDVNGDGILDVMAASYYRNSGGSVYMGRVHVVFGKSSGAEWSSQVFASQLQADGTGFTVTMPCGLFIASLAAADVNGDGIADLLIGVPNANVYAPSVGSSPPYTGAVFVVFGKKGAIADVDLNAGPLDGTDGFVIVHRTNNARFGQGIAIGDINGDGVADIIVSGRAGSSNGYGAVYIIFGGQVQNLPALPAGLIVKGGGAG